MTSTIISTTQNFNQIVVKNTRSLSHSEAGTLSYTEIERVLQVVDSLEGADWQQPTDCTEWTVRDMVAHLVGACAGSCSWAEFKRQNFSNPYRHEYKELIDAINKVQIEDRKHLSTQEIVAALHSVGKKAVASRQNLPWLVRNLRFPMGELGFAPLHYLMDTIYPRDQWMHRIDICRTTGKNIVLTPEHDGRMVELVMRDLDQKLPENLSVELQLTGKLQQAFLFGKDTVPQATIRMDCIEFHRLASGRITREQAFEIISISGNEQMAHQFIEQCKVSY